jgi:formylglycine-generating enzyme required for sulfatase activity
MGLPVALLKVIGKGVLNAVGGGVVGDVLFDALPEVAREVYGWWFKDRTPAQQREEVQALVQARPAEVRAAAHEVVLELAGDKPPELQKALEIYLSQVPGAVRQSLRRPADPEGLSLPLALAFQEPEDVLPLLPTRLPRFQPGDRPLPGIDWELTELLGVGGFGEVWKARNPHFDAVPPVALKFCLDPGAKDRLLRHEAAVLNQVMRQGKHPGIVALQHTYLSADPPCLEYEYVAGGDLTGLIGEWRSLPVGAERAGRAARVLRDLAQIVGFAHRQSPPVVHRDLKPANILVQQDASGAVQLRVADFGIGGVAASQALAHTARGTSQGAFLVTALRGAHTPLYASAQQMRGLPPDPRDDVYSLGVIWYQLLTGNLLAGRPGGSRWSQRLKEQGVPVAMLDLLQACVEDEPADRPRDAADLAERLTPLLAPPTVPTPAAPAPPRVVALPPRLTVSAGIKMALISSGSFQMGSPTTEMSSGFGEGPQHRVTISRPFYLGVYPVTQEQYETVMGCNPSRFTTKEKGGPQHPVEQVSWDDAVEFCRRLSVLPTEKQAKHTYRLPSEAEWEYACRAGSQMAFAFGDSLSSTQANFDGSRPYGSGRTGPNLQRTSRAGAYAANVWGLYDMHGNVWEWCQDWYDENYYQVSPEIDPRGPDAGTQRVLRGGSWNNSGHLCRSARRNKYAPDFRSETIGFRIVLQTGAI